MARFDSGVRWYTHGEIRVDVYFPEDSVMCRYCPFLRADANGARYKCTITGSILPGIEYVPDDCPVIISKEAADNE